MTDTTAVIQKIEAIAQQAIWDRRDLIMLLVEWVKAHGEDSPSLSLKTQLALSLIIERDKKSTETVQ